MALKLDTLGPGPVDDTPPLLGITAAPVPPRVTTTPNPVGQQVGWQTLSCTHQLLDGVDASALAIRDVLCGPQLPTVNLVLVWT